MPDVPIQIRLMAAERSAQAGPAPSLHAPPDDLFRRFSHDFPDFQLVTIERVRGGGYFDVRTRSGALRKRVRAISLDSDWWTVGLVVVMGHYDREKRDPYLRNPVGRQLLLWTAFAWSCSRGNPHNNFLAGRPGPFLDLASPRQIDTFTKNGAVMGLLYYTIAKSAFMASKTNPGPLTGTSGYVDLFYASDPAKTVGSDADYKFKERVSNTAPGNTFANWHYCDDLQVLIWVASGGSLSTRLIVLDATSGSTPDASPVTDSSFVTPMTSVVISGLNAYEGAVVCRQTLVKTHHGSHSYQHDYSAHTTTDAANVNLKSIVGLSLPSGAVAWRWDPNTIWDGSATIPYLRELCSPAEIGSAGDPGGMHLGQPYPWPNIGIGPALLLPGHPGVYLRGDTAETDLVVFPLSGRVTCSEELTVWTNPDYPSLERIRRYVDTSQQMRPNDVFNPGLITAMSLGVFAPTYKQTGGGTGGFYLISTPGSASGAIHEYRIGSNSYPQAGRDNSSELRAWLVALDPGTGTQRWKYEFPTLIPSEHYFVDLDSFARVSASPWIAIWLASATNAISTPTANASSSVVYPSQVTLANYVNTFDRQYAVAEDSVENHLYWPNGAQYLFDPVLFTRTGENGANAGTHSNLVADRDGEFLYSVYLQPYLFVSCADIWHRPDASIADRTHSADTTYCVANNGYESDRLTVKANRVDVWAKIDFGATFEPFPVGLTQKTFDATFYGDPHIIPCFRSFLGKWSKDGELVWTKELTTYHNETIDSSAGLNGRIPYPGLTLRICPTNAGVFLLRLERLPIQTSLREAAFIPPHQYRTGGVHAADQIRTDFIAHTFNSKAVLELRDTDGNVVWKKTIYDPTDIAPAWLCSAAMFASEANFQIESNDSWVVGRVDFSTNHTSKTLWMDNTPAYDPLTRVSKVFRCNAAGSITIQDADASSMDSLGFWPRDFNSDASYTNGILRQQASMLMGGTLIYPVGPSDFRLWAVGQ
ncbi:MAG: hypothetical protein ACH37Z_11510 [Anaerolineae bacterium]